MPISSDTLQRQWQTLRLIPRYPRKITGSDLTERLGAAGFAVTKRTVERDLQSLSVTFPILVDTRSMPYGWSWEKGAVALDVPALSPIEAASVLMLRKFLHPLLPASLLDHMAPYFRMAEQCLAAKQGVAPWRQWLKKVAIVPASQALIPAKVDAAVQDGVCEALLQSQQLHLTYLKRGDSSPADYRVHPLGLIQRGGVFYLVATLFDYPDLRLLALHRIKSAVLLDTTANKPKGFSLDAYLAEGHAGFLRSDAKRAIRLVARFSREAGEHLWETPLSKDQVLTECEDGYLELGATVADTSQLRWWLLAFGDGVEVLGPQNLRQHIAARVSRAAQKYRLA